jgi:hypothetical protein
MTERFLPPNYDSHRVSIGGFDISVRLTDGLEYYFKTSIFVRGDSIRKMQSGLNYVALGAGPCVNGFSIDANGDAHIYHVSPKYFRDEIPEIDGGYGGLIGGSVRDFEPYHPVVQSNFIGVKGYPMSFLVRMLSDTSMEVFYRAGH